MRTSTLRGLIGAVCGPLLACGDTAAEPTPFEPVADIAELMEALIDPHADVIWDSVGFIMTEEGTEEVRPRSDEAWAQVRNSAIALAESANLLMIPPRARDSGEWLAASRALLETSRSAIRATEAQDPEELFKVGGYIYNTCSNCHQKYPAEAPAQP